MCLMDTLGLNLADGVSILLLQNRDKSAANFNIHHNLLKRENYTSAKVRIIL